MIYKVLGGLAILAAVFAGGFFKGKSIGDAKLAEQRAVWTVAYDKQAAETKRIEAQWAVKFKERDDAWEAKLAVAESTVGGLSARLRRATSRGSCPVPADSASAGTPDGGRVHASVEEAERLSDDAWRAAAANTAKLNECVARYNALRE